MSASDRRIHILLACDKFRGSLSAQQAIKGLQEGLYASSTNITLEGIALADGGEGTLCALMPVLGCTSRPIEVSDALGKKAQSYIGYNSKEKTAVLEMASYVGLAQLDSSDRNPMNTSSYGLGQAIKRALEIGARKILLGIGGSATNDGGAGMLSALGFTFYDRSGDKLYPNGGNLSSIQKIVPPETDFSKLEITIISDVDNPICGETGAIYMFAQQKGASKHELEALEKGMKHYATLVQQFNQTDVFTAIGYGAAGGIPLSACTFLKAKLVSGSRYLFELLNLKSKIEQADLVIAGEGKIDDQTLHGKAIQPIIEHTLSLKKPLFLVCGIFDVRTGSIAKNISVITLADLAKEFNKDSFKGAYELIREAGIRIAHSFKGT
jgi:glycerate kinase